MTGYKLQFGSYAFPATFAPVHREQVNVVPSAKNPRRYGATSILGTQDASRLTIRGGFIKGPIPTPGLTTLKTSRDEMLYYLFTAGQQNLYFGDDDRYYRNAQVDRVTDDYEATGWGRVAQYEIAFICPDGRPHSVDLNSVAWFPVVSGETHNFNHSGPAPAEPIISFTVAGAGAKTIAYSLTNNNNGQAFTLAGSVNGGDVIVVDTYEKTVVIGTDDRIDLFDGLWVSLSAGTFGVGLNTYAVTFGAVGINEILLQWRDRYL